MSKFPEDWQKCLEVLDCQLTENEFNTWIRPIQCAKQDNSLHLFFPNDMLLKRFSRDYQSIISPILEHLDPPVDIALRKGSASQLNQVVENESASKVEAFQSNLNATFTLENYVKGKSNEIASAAAQQVGKNPGVSYNPLVIYGCVGLGKTHLMHAIGHLILEANQQAKISYVHSERFVSEMIRALQQNDMESFKHRYRSLDVLLIDDIQFFAGKGRSQEELFHTVNSLLDSGQQIVITSDRYPKELDGIEDRLKSRFSWGLSVCIEPPELETRVAILLSKAAGLGVDLPEDVAFFIAQEIQSNVRELEGALRRVIASSEFQGRAITRDFAQEALKDLIVAKARMITLDSIMSKTAQFYNLKTTDLLSKKRTRHIARARQMAMKLAYELTSNSYPQIGHAFGVDHTTVMYACRKIVSLMNDDPALKEEYELLLRKINH